MTRVHPNWLTCQINGVAEYICSAPASPHVLRALADDFRRAAEAVDLEIKRRELTEHDFDNGGLFG